jgi:esterase/lipase
LVYVFPKVPVFPDPKGTKAFLDKVYFDAFKEIKLLKKQGKRINFIGHSLPNVLMFRLMKKFDFGKAVAISPGANLADCIWESIATKHVKDKAIEEGMNLRYFKKILRDYNPEDNVRKMRGKIELYAGKFDPMIPFEQAKRVEVALKKKGNKVKLHRFNFSGHTTTILSFKH